MGIKELLIRIWREEDGIFGINVGPSVGELGATANLTNESNFAGAQGEGLISQSSGIMSALMSGNQAQISKILAPQINAISKQANEKIQTNAQFGSRSGGTNASNQNTMDTARAGVNDMTSKLTSDAVNGAATTGTSLLNSSMAGNNDVFNQNVTEQNQRASKENDEWGSYSSVAANILKKK
jgi:hypothetical protein